MIYEDNDALIDKIHLENRIPMFNPANILKIQNYCNIDKYIKHEYFIYIDNKGQQHTAVNNTTNIKKFDVQKICLIKKHEFYKQLEKNFAHLNLAKSKYLLGFLSPTLTTRNINFIKIITIFKLVFCASLYKSAIIFHLFNACSYFVQNVLKFMLFNRVIANYKKPVSIDANVILPIYTILVPLYKEVEKLNSIINAIDKLHYPKDKLDVKIIVEQDDEQLISSLRMINLPSYMHVILIPFATPRTKPKALNYAITYAAGQYITIYDAEDEPETDQLIKVVNAFNTLPDEYVCIQAKLNFYNKNRNLLTKFCSIEYAIWFEYLLQGLSLSNYPVTLGGTSNHFKTKYLRELGCWDAYNVTEDAELGIRLYMAGYKTYIIDSYTLEESTVHVKAWINQRSRWIKGFIQTLIICALNKSGNVNLSLSQKFATYTFIGMSSYNFYSLPWSIVFITINPNLAVNKLWFASAVFGLIYCYSTTFYVLFYHKQNDKLQRKTFTDYLALILCPFYFLLHSIASYRALWELVTTPYFWNKTSHGVDLKIDENRII